MTEYQKKAAWHPVEADDCPDDGHYILLSFINFNLPSVGRYEVDEDGGAFYIGDDDRPAISYGIVVNAWMPLPEPFRYED